VNAILGGGGVKAQSSRRCWRPRLGGGVCRRHATGAGVLGSPRRLQAIEPYLVASGGIPSMRYTLSILCSGIGETRGLLVALLVFYPVFIKTLRKQRSDRPAGGMLRVLACRK